MARNGTRRGRSRAAKEALARLRRFKSRPNLKQINGIAADTGVHWTTVYRLLREAA